MFAVIVSGGKQYKVSQGDLVSVDKIAGEKGDKVSFDAIAYFDGKEVKTSPVKVTAEIQDQMLADKIIVFKYKAKKNERKKQGHRQPFTKLKIVEIKA